MSRLPSFKFHTYFLLLIEGAVYIVLRYRRIFRMQQNKNKIKKGQGANVYTRKNTVTHIMLCHRIYCMYFFLRKEVAVFCVGIEPAVFKIPPSQEQK